MRYVIIGAGEQVKNVMGLFKVDVAFIFDEPRTPGERKCGLPIFSFNPFETEDLRWIAPIRETRHKRELVMDALKCDALMGNLTHPTAVIAKNAVRGLGVYMQPYAVLYENARVGAHTTILGRASVGHDADVGEFCTLGHHSFIGGHVTLGQGVEIGAGAEVLPGKRIGEGAVVGAGAVVTKNIPPNEVWIGVPAKPMMEGPKFAAGTYYPTQKMMPEWRGR